MKRHLLEITAGVTVGFLLLLGFVSAKREWQIRSAKSYVAAQLIDPDSAKFRNVEWCGNGIIRGEINGKNGFGAYSGFAPFVAQANKAIIMDFDSDDELLDDRWRIASAACDQAKSGA